MAIPVSQFRIEIPTYEMDLDTAPSSEGPVSLLPCVQVYSQYTLYNFFEWFNHAKEDYGCHRYLYQSDETRLAGVFGLYVYIMCKRPPSRDRKSIYLPFPETSPIRLYEEPITIAHSRFRLLLNLVWVLFRFCLGLFTAVLVKTSDEKGVRKGSGGSQNEPSTWLARRVFGLSCV